MKKSILITAAAIVTARSVSQPVLASEAVCYYSFNSGGSAVSHYYSTSTFSKSTGSVAVVGWQDTSGPAGADAYYNVVKKGIVYDTYIGTGIHITGDYTQSGYWFTDYIHNVPAGSGYSIRIDPVTVYTTGAGNGY